MNSKTMMHFIFHGFSAIMYFCAIVRYEQLPPMPHRRSHEHYAGRFKYLTYWNLLVQFAFFATMCVMDLMKTSTSKYNKMVRLRDKLYAGIVLPYGVFVVAMFWTLYGIDRELIFPRVLDAIFPPWLNHVSHTVILPVLLVETYIVKHRHPSKQTGLLIALAFGLTYNAWVLYLGLVKDIWVYPILQILDWTQRFVFFSLSIVLLYFMYTIGEKINTFIWGQSIVQKNK